MPSSPKCPWKTGQIKSSTRGIWQLLGWLTKPSAGLHTARLWHRPPKTAREHLRAKWPQQISSEGNPQPEVCLETCSGRILTEKQQIVVWRWLYIKYLLLVSIIYAILEVVLAILLQWDAQIHSNLGSSGQGNGLLTSGKLKCQEQSYRHLFTRLLLFCFTGPRFVFLSNCSINIFTIKERCQITSTSLWDLELNCKIFIWGQSPS